MLQKLIDKWDVLQYKYYCLKSDFKTWKFWNLDGWPFKRRCPICAGDGVRNTETGARYGDPPFECEHCRGCGFVKR
jgi:hypothetical protein